MIEPRNTESAPQARDGSAQQAPLPVADEGRRPASGQFSAWNEGLSLGWIASDGPSACNTPIATPSQWSR